jgi:hypothetical protein
VLAGTVKNLYNKHKTKRTWPSLKELSDTLQVVTRSYSKVFVIVDALDECALSNGCRPKFLSEMFSLQANCVLNIFATSRFIPEITEKFNKSTHLEIRASDQDVQRYLDSHIVQLPRFVLESSDLQAEIKTEIIKAVNGMYVTSYPINK